MTEVSPPSLSFEQPDPLLVSALERATCKADVRHLMQTQDTDSVMRAWQAINPAQRNALLLVRALDGTIIHELPADL